jgi:hypothetical protein
MRHSPTCSTTARRIGIGQPCDGPLLAAAVGAELEQWADTGYYPPRAVMCAAEHPISGALCRRIDCLGDHDHDGLPPWTEEETVTDAPYDTTPDIDDREQLVDVLDMHMRLDGRGDAERVADALIGHPGLLHRLSARAVSGAGTPDEPREEHPMLEGWDLQESRVAAVLGAAFVEFRNSDRAASLTDWQADALVRAEPGRGPGGGHRIHRRHPCVNGGDRGRDGEGRRDDGAHRVGAGRGQRQPTGRNAGVAAASQPNRSAPLWLRATHRGQVVNIDLCERCGFYDSALDSDCTCRLVADPGWSSRLRAEVRRRHQASLELATHRTLAPQGRAA